eukprot:gene20626-24771_t
MFLAIYRNLYVGVGGEDGALGKFSSLRNLDSFPPTKGGFSRPWLLFLPFISKRESRHAKSVAPWWAKLPLGRSLGAIVDEFKRRYGIHKDVARDLVKETGCREDHVMWTLDYLRQYTCFEDRADKYDGCCSKTYGDKVWHVLATAFERLERPNIEHKKVYPDASRPGGTLTMAIDCTFCPYLTHDQSFYSFKHSDVGFKYEVGVNIETGEILWCRGPYKGAASDVTIFRKHLKQTINVDGLERYIGDKGYQGEQQYLLTPVKKPANGELTDQENIYNNWVSHYRIIVENCFAKFKIFKCFSTPWRSSLKKHKQAFFLVVWLVNREIARRTKRRHLDEIIEPISP